VLVYISKNLIIGVAAGLLLLALALVLSRANKSGSKRIPPVILALVLLGAWFGWFSFIKIIVERF